MGNRVKRYFAPWGRSIAKPSNLSSDPLVGLTVPSRLTMAQETHLLLNPGLAEKTFQSYRVSVRGKGGHSSMPSAATDIVPRLARAPLKVSELRFAPHALSFAREQLGAGGEGRPARGGRGDAQAT